MIETDEFIKIVKAHLETKTPLSYVRYSDGEIMLLNRREYYQTYIKIIYRLWGYVPDEDELVAIDGFLRHALRNADYIGYPTERHRARADYFRDADKVFKKRVGPLEDYSLASVDIPYIMLNDERYSEILYKCHTLNYVSCWDLDQQFQDRFSIAHVNHFLVSGEPKFSSATSRGRHFPDQFYQVRKWIKARNCKGNVCLVGAGVFSKIYNTWFAEQGGVSLDIGSVFDSWHGVKTRGQGKGMDVEDLTYKL